MGWHKTNMLPVLRYWRFCDRLVTKRTALDVSSHRNKPTDRDADLLAPHYLNHLHYEYGSPPLPAVTGGQQIAVLRMYRFARRSRKAQFMSRAVKRMIMMNPAEATTREVYTLQSVGEQ